MVAKQTFAEWQKAGKDVHSIIADPGFANPSILDFRVQNKSLVAKIKFKPFDYSRAGVHGTPEWKELAKFDVKLAQAFDDIVAAHESEKAK